MKNSRIITYIIAYLWFATAVFGLVILVNYSNTKGTSSNHFQKAWPLQSKIERGLHPTLVMFVHPFCPCSMASIGELERLMPFIHDKVDVSVVFISLRNMQGASASEWKETQLYSAAKKIPGVHLLRDEDELEAKIFGAETSGHTVFYNQQGKLLFTGGLTPSRGHMGDSVGRTKILSWIENNNNDERVESSIFGCALRTPASM